MILKKSFLNSRCFDNPKVRKDQIEKVCRRRKPMRDKCIIVEDLEHNLIKDKNK